VTNFPNTGINRLVVFDSLRKAKALVWGGTTGLDSFPQLTQKSARSMRTREAKRTFRIGNSPREVKVACRQNEVGEINGDESAHRCSFVQASVYGGRQFTSTYK
jgi:hypothetical protein